MWYGAALKFWYAARRRRSCSLSFSLSLSLSISLCVLSGIKYTKLEKWGIALAAYIPQSYGATHSLVSRRYERITSVYFVRFNAIEAARARVNIFAISVRQLIFFK